MARFKSDYDRIGEVVKRLHKPSWVKRFHQGDEDAAASALALAHGYEGRVGYMRHLCKLREEHPGQTDFEQNVREYHELGLRVMAAGMADCEITDDPTLKAREDPLSDLVGDCYRLAYYFILDSAPDGSYLVHGHVGESGDGSTHTGHAWVELSGDVVYDGVLMRFYRRECYYAKRDAKGTRVFPKGEVLMTHLVHRHFGPWAD